MLDFKLRLLAVATVFAACSLFPGCGKEVLVIGTHMGTGGEKGSGGAQVHPGTGGAAVGTGGALGVGGSLPTPGTGGAVAGTGGRGVGGSTPPIVVNGYACTSSLECMSGFCVSGVCCNTACTGECMTCTATPGTCMPRAAGESCGSGPTCDSTGTKLIAAQVCDGAGTCAPGAVQGCPGFGCVNGACASGCAGDADCVVGRFCSAGTCYTFPGNLAGNGDGEYGTLDGWVGFAGSTVALSDTMAAGSSHFGRYAVRSTARTQDYQGPSYMLPTGVGKYSISLWGMQKDVAALTGVAMIGLTCATSTQYVQVQSDGFGTTLTPTSWTEFAAMVDTSPLSDCDPTASPPGLVRSAQLFLNQMSPTSPTAFPDLYIDDLRVQVADGHNLVGNPNFEAGLTDGWTASGAAAVSVSSTLSKGVTHSLSVASRTTTDSGPTYALPTGPGKYNVNLQTLHTGVASHDLAFQAAYTCSGGSQVLTAPFGSGLALTPNTWHQLAGIVTLPPPNAPAGCRLTQAAVSLKQLDVGTCAASGGSVECPDLYIDDVSITLTY